MRVSKHGIWKTILLASGLLILILAWLPKPVPPSPDFRPLAPLELVHMNPDPSFSGIHAFAYILL